jgi:hypothetical protein
MYFKFSIALPTWDKKLIAKMTYVLKIKTRILSANRCFADLGSISTHMDLKKNKDDTVQDTCKASSNLCF